MGEFTPFAVHDSRVSTSVVPGISSGYVPFKRGLTVLETLQVGYTYPKN